MLDGSLPAVLYQLFGFSIHDRDFRKLCALLFRSQWVPRDGVDAKSYPPATRTWCNVTSTFGEQRILHPGELTRRRGRDIRLAVETTLTGSGFELLPLHRSTPHARAETERGTKNKESALRRPARIPHATDCNTGNLRAPKRMPSQ